MCDEAVAGLSGRSTRNKHHNGAAQRYFRTFLPPYLRIQPDGQGIADGLVDGATKRLQKHILTTKKDDGGGGKREGLGKMGSQEKWGPRKWEKNGVHLIYPQVAWV